MFVFLSVIILILNQCSGQADVTALKHPKIFIAILARNKEHTIPYFLSLLEEQDYPKDRISLWFRSDHNRDSTPIIVKTWVDSVKHLYHSVNLTINEGETDFSDEKSPSHWTKTRFNHVINLREEALNEARRSWADFIMFLDCDIFLTYKHTLEYLVSQEYPVVAPMLKSNGMFSNFWCGMTSKYYYLRTEDYQPILKRERKGCFHVPMVHSAVMINLNTMVSDRLSFVPSNIPNYKGPVDDIITFAMSANFSGIPLHVCNEEVFGYIMVPLEEDNPLENDYLVLTNLMLEILVENPPLTVNKLLVPYVPERVPDKMGLDEIFMINLKRRPERRTRMAECFKHLNLNVTINDAVDGRTIDDNVISDLGIQFMPEYKDPYHKRAMTHGEIGCFLSHYFIWKQIVEKGYQVVMVLEDDVRFEPYFREKLTALMNELKDLDLYWDLIYLGRKRLQDKEDWVKGCTSLVHVAYSYWTLGYLLTLNGAKKLLEQDPLKNLIPVDEYLPILFDQHPEADWKRHFEKRDLVAFSAAPLLLYPTHYTGEEGYISDTEDSEIIQKKPTEQREDL
ncbi:UNVERIFIED_CONTAM: hypothetical protein PYX00_001518 [Menopon gallinae]|uniref:Glycosyl transferase family 25 domain-containing protein n=1 Tax=Menopon gallinae TaxID=328185 RepID=A0AAW2IEE9_9NEOP